MLIIHVLATIAVVIANIALGVNFTEWAITLIIIGVVMASELINTAIEAVVDLVTLEIHPLAKIAKDCGSAATFVLSILAVFIALFIYVPYIIELFK